MKQEEEESESSDESEDVTVPKDEEKELRQDDDSKLKETDAHTKKTYDVDLNFKISANCHIEFMGRSSHSLIKTSIDLTETSSWNSNKWLNELKHPPWSFN